jgi:hypothetical protein
VLLLKTGKSGRMKTCLEIVMMGSCGEVTTPPFDYRRRTRLLPHVDSVELDFSCHRTHCVL